MKNDELLDEVITDLGETLDTTLNILVDKGASANLPCIREATQEDLESLDSRRQTIREKVDMIIFLQKELNPEDNSGAWLLTSVIKVEELLTDSAYKMAVALRYYYEQMSKSLRSLKEDNSTGIEVLDLINDPEYNRLVDEAMEAFKKSYYMLRFMLSRVENMNEGYPG